MEDKLIISIANEFSKLLREYLGPEKMKIIVERNKSLKYVKRGLCATHDFCDPNQFMLDACEKYKVDPVCEDEKKREEGFKISSIAWDLAKANHFSHIN